MVGDIENPAEDISMHSLYELSQRTHDFTKNDSILEEEKKTYCNSSRIKFTLLNIKEICILSFMCYT